MRTRLAWLLAVVSLLTPEGTAGGDRPVPPGLEGSWEGEFQGPDAPVYIALHLERRAETWGGSIDVLGRTLPLEAVIPSAGGVRAVLESGPDGAAVEAALSGDQLTGTLVQHGRGFPLTLSRIPRRSAPADRTEGWRQDLDALSNRFLRFDRSFTPAARLLARERIDGLSAQVPELSDAEILMRMAAVVALSGNPHTRLYLLRNRTELRRLPVRLWWFNDGLYVVRARTDHRDLLGCRLDEIAGIPVRGARDRVAMAFAGNPSWTDYKSVYFMTSPEALRGAGVTHDDGPVEMTFSQCRKEAWRVRVEPLPLEKKAGVTEAWWDLSPRRQEEGWEHVLEGANPPLPLYLRQTDRHYWFESLADSGLLYFQYSRASETNLENLGVFSGRLLAELDRHQFRAFVLDLRFNTGGNLGLAQGLMAEIERRTRSVPRFVITGRATFSAGITHAAAWKEAPNVTFVGEEVGDDLDFWAEGGNIVLPNSGLTAHFANAFHSYSERPCPADVPCYLDLNARSLRPDVPVSSKWADYAAGIDVALDAVHAALQAATTASRPSN
jgi:hypothetical protein